MHTYSSVTGLWSDRSSEWVRWKHGGGWVNGEHTEPLERDVAGPLSMACCIFSSTTSRQSCMTVAVNGQGNTCRIIPWPDQRECPQVAFISQSQGHLHCISELVKGSDFSFPGLSIWVLEDYDSIEWVLKHSLSF